MKDKNRGSLFLLSFLLAATLLAGGACVVGSSHPCAVDADCSEGLRCRSKWCVPAWYEGGSAKRDGGSSEVPDQTPDAKQGDNPCPVCLAGTTRPCFPKDVPGCKADGTNCQGVCAAGVEVCKPSQGRCGVWSGSCLGPKLREKETCNNLDDDCDGKVDEEITRVCFEGAPSQRNVGVCKEGLQTCTAGKWSACKGSGTPSFELCNQADDDCDGKLDNLPAAATLPFPGGLLNLRSGELLPRVYRAPLKDGGFYFATTFHKTFVWNKETFRSSSPDISNMLVGKANAKRQIEWVRYVTVTEGIKPLAILFTRKGRLLVGGVSGKGDLLSSYPTLPVRGGIASQFNAKAFAFLAEFASDGSDFRTLLLAEYTSDGASSAVTTLAENSKGEILVGGNFTIGFKFGLGRRLSGAVTSLPFLQHYSSAVDFTQPPDWENVLLAKDGEALLNVVVPHPSDPSLWLVGGSHKGMLILQKGLVPPKGGEAGYLGFVSNKDGSLGRVYSLGDPAKINAGATTVTDLLATPGGKLTLLLGFDRGLEVPKTGGNLLLSKGGVAIVHYNPAKDTYEWAVAPKIVSAAPYLVGGLKLSNVGSTTIAVTGYLGTASLDWGTSRIEGTRAGLNYWVGFVDTQAGKLTTGFGSGNPLNGFQLFSGVRPYKTNLVEVFGAYQKPFSLGTETVHPQLGAEGGWFWKVLDPKKGWQCP